MKRAVVWLLLVSVLLSVVPAAVAEDPQPPEAAKTQWEDYSARVASGKVFYQEKDLKDCCYFLSLCKESKQEQAYENGFLSRSAAGLSEEILT